MVWRGNPGGARMLRPVVTAKGVALAVMIATVIYAAALAWSLGLAWLVVF
jgi:hypothetical protein